MIIILVSLKERDKDKDEGDVPPIVNDNYGEEFKGVIKIKMKERSPQLWMIIILVSLKERDNRLSQQWRVTPVC